jgi:hypothetical protein
VSQAIQTAIEELMAQITAKEAEVAPLKIAVNTLCRQLGQPDAYSNVGGGPSQQGSPVTLSWKLDQFHRRPLATCVVEILETRKSRGLEGPASIDEIYSALKEGGYQFEGTSGNEENTKRAIKIALTKNTAQFSKVKDDIFGLKKWYSGSGRSTRKSASVKSENGNGETETGSETSEAESPPELEEKAEILEKEAKTNSLT